MKLKSRHAVISFCPDLTDPDAVSVPVAILMVVEAEEGLAAAALGREVHNVDRITRECLRDIPRLVKDSIESIEDATTVDEVLHNLQNSLRNSLHVSKISEQMTVELLDGVPMEAQFATLYEAAHRAFNTELEALGHEPLLPVKLPVQPTYRDQARFGKPGIVSAPAMPSAAAIWKLGGGDKYGSGAPVD